MTTGGGAGGEEVGVPGQDWEGGEDLDVPAHAGGDEGGGGEGVGERRGRGVEGAVEVDAEAADAAAVEVFEGGLGGVCRVDDGDAAAVLAEGVEGLEGDGVVGAVEAGLDDDEAGDAVGGGFALDGGEGGREWGVGAGGEEAFGGADDVDVGVDVCARVVHGVRPNWARRAGSMPVRWRGGRAA